MKKLKKKLVAAKAAKTVKAAKIEISQIHNTSAAEMPNPAARNRPLRKDVRFAFRK